MSLALVPAPRAPREARWPHAVLKRNANLLARIAPEGAVPLQAKMLGTGKYGSVFGTEAEKVVCKLTRDATEAHMAARLLQWGSGSSLALSGIVTYYAVAALKDETAYGSQVYALWRERARRIGDVEWASSEADDSLRTFWRLADIVYRYVRPAAPDWQARRDRVVQQFSWAAGHADPAVVDLHEPSRWEGSDYVPSLDLVDGAWLRNPHRAAWAVQQCKWLAGDLAQDDTSALLGKSLEYLLDRGILLADTHRDNTGWADRPDEDGDMELEWVIIDPGRAVPLDPSLPPVDIPVV
jgi:hypothetical protein